MNRPFTIYFDTNFYIWLAQATNEEATDVISKLNEIEVRHVLSGKIILELLSGKERKPQDKTLLERVKTFKIDPLKISINHLETHSDNDINWDALLLSGEPRNSFAMVLKSIYDIETIAQSHSNMASKKLNKDKAEKLNESMQPFLSSIGYDEKQSKEDNANAFAGFASELISSLSFNLPDEQRRKLEAIDFTIEKTPENLLNISNQILSSLGVHTVEKLEEEKRIINSTIALDPRPFNIAINETSNKEIKGLGNTFRDAGHMNLFVTYHDQIDLIQVDSHQKRLIERNKPKHRLSELGLANRCFSVDNLSQIVDVVTNNKQIFSI